MRSFSVLVCLALSPAALAANGVLADCDFDGDGYGDVAAGAPAESINGDLAAGAVHIFYSSFGGLNASRDQFLHQDRGGIDDVTEPGDNFGASLACGDFDGDGYDDLAVGAPHESVGDVAYAGQIHLIYGSADGLDFYREFRIHEDMLGSGVAGRMDRFGETLASGDFDGDGYDDLAIGVPGETVSGNKRGGAFVVLEGSYSGITTSGSRHIHQNTRGVPGGAESDGQQSADEFGQTLAVGDFNGDGRDDLAVGAPREGIVFEGSNKSRAGAVWVFPGSRSGLSTSASTSYSQATDGISGDPESGDTFGASLAAGDFDGDGRDDLAIGAPTEKVGSSSSAGMVHVLPGSASGLDPSGEKLFHQNTSGIAGAVEDGDRFGLSLVAGHFDGDSRMDLAIGAPGEDLGSTRAAGMVHLLRGSSSGLSASGDQAWHQDSSGVLSSAEKGDHFGESLAAGDLDADGRWDLIIGVPNESIGSLASGGQFQVLYGTASGVGASDDQHFHQDIHSVLGVVEPQDRLASGLAMSTNIYRLPYADGTSVRVSNDHHNHWGRYDLVGTGGSTYEVVAAADGRILTIEDDNTASQCGSSTPGGCRNNYVHILHANGEITKYSHMRPGTVAARGWAEGDTVKAGEVLGIEGDIGFTTGDHVHFHVVVPDKGGVVTIWEDFDANDDGFIEGTMVTPRICGVGAMARGATYTATDCN